LKTYEQFINNTLTLYHGTYASNSKQFDKLNSPLFLSTERSFSGAYGKYLYEVKISPKKIFDSLDNENIEKIKNNPIIRNNEDVLDLLDNEIYKTNRTWVWVEKILQDHPNFFINMGYDCIRIIENKTINYIIWSTDVIDSFKLWKPDPNKTHSIKSKFHFLKEQFTENDFSELKKIAYDYVKNWHSDEYINDIYEYINTNFPYGLQNIPNPVTLYRILQVNSPAEINKRKLGYHFVGDVNFFNNKLFRSIGLETHWKKFIVTIQTTPDNIHYKKTLLCKIGYPDEHEYTIKDDTILKIINIEEYEDI
jgi:hypothetical protein